MFCPEYLLQLHGTEEKREDERMKELVMVSGQKSKVRPQVSPSSISEEHQGCLLEDGPNFRDVPWNAQDTKYVQVGPERLINQ